MKKRVVVLALCVVMFCAYEFGTDLIAITAGQPLKLLGSTGALSPYDLRGRPVKPMLHATVRGKSLHLVIRTFFHHAGPFTRPYLTVDDDQNGIIHINTRARFGFATKCEFMRQLEIEVSAEDWKQLKKLSVFNGDTRQLETTVIPVGETVIFRRELAQSWLPQARAESPC